MLLSKMTDGPKVNKRFNRTHKYHIRKTALLREERTRQVVSADDCPNPSLIPRAYHEINLNVGHPLDSYTARNSFVRADVDRELGSVVLSRFERIKAIVAEKGRRHANERMKRDVFPMAHLACRCRGYRAPRTLIEYASSPVEGVATRRQGVPVPVNAIRDYQASRSGTRDANQRHRTFRHPSALAVSVYPRRTCLKFFFNFKFKNIPSAIIKNAVT